MVNEALRKMCGIWSAWSEKASNELDRRSFVTAPTGDRRLAVFLPFQVA
jgi:hypothetical protein